MVGDQSLSPAERWGWELRAPQRTVTAPFTGEPPGLPAVDAGWLPRLARHYQRAVTSWRGHLVRAAGLAAMAILWWLLYGWWGGPALWGAVGFTAVAGVSGYLAARPLLLPGWADVRYRRWRAEVIGQLDQVAARSRAWVHDRDDHERERARPAPVWEPVRPVATARIDVYGGGADGWTALLTSAIASMVATEVEVTVIDLSRDGIGGRIAVNLSGGGVLVDRVRLPAQLATVGLFDGLDAAAAAAAISEVVAAVDRDDGHRTIDASVLEQVIGCLSGPVTFGRLSAALRVVTRSGPGMASGSGDLGDGEYRALTDLLGESARRATAPRLFRIAAAVQQLAAMEAGGGGGDSFPEPYRQVRVWEVTEQVADVGAELLAQLTVQVLLHRLRRDTAPVPPAARAVALIGVDALRRGAVERLDQLARRRGIRLVLCSRHLRDDAAEVLGGGDAVVFMRLGNAREAEQAATFIGREHRLVASQFTASRSASTTTTFGGSASHTTTEQESRTEGTQWSRARRYDRGFGVLDLPHDGPSGSRGGQQSTTSGTGTSLTVGSSWSEQTGHSVSESVSYQRVYEYTVTPTFLQELSPTAFVLVDPRDPGSPRLGDCGIDPTATRSNPGLRLPPMWVE